LEIIAILIAMKPRLTGRAGDSVNDFLSVLFAISFAEPAQDALT